MKIAATTVKGGLDDTIIDIFGRAPYFTIVEVDNGKILDVEVVKNDNAAASGGAGIAAAQLMIEKGVSSVLTGRVGPNAFNVLSSAGINVYDAAGLKVRDAIEKLLNGELETVASPGKGGGMGRGMGRGRGGGRGMGRGWM